jgi:hypothetical protein
MKSHILDLPTNFTKHVRSNYAFYNVGNWRQSLDVITDIVEKTCVFEVTINDKVVGFFDDIKDAIKVYNDIDTKY